MIAFTKQPPANVLVNNPVLFEVESNSMGPVRYTVRIEQYHGVANYVIFNGVLLPVLDIATSKYYSSLNISELLRSYLLQASISNPAQLVSRVDNFSMGFSVNFQDGYGYNLSYQGKFFQGGIGKKMLRYLNNSNTDIFAYKIQNTDKQFFLTTRTSGRHIVIKENELSPLYFIATNKTYVVVTEYGQTFTFPAMITGDIYAFNIEVLRRLSYNTYQKIPAFLGILVDGRFVFDITIKEPSKSPNKYILEFRNSFSVFERLEITGKANSEPEFAEDNAFMAYDRHIDDYVEQNNRLGIREIIKAEFGYKSLEEFLFMRDMFQSDKRYLIGPDGTRHEVRISVENFSHNLFPTDPGSVQLTIRLVDNDSNYSPGIDDSLPDFNFGEAIWLTGNTNGYGFLFSDSILNTI
ncbi:hypothetical protein [Proteiniphilum sp.]|uniref:hypothetical protein n=1 Tax=Proteiniphilum sp. TaxID=1926877 RepID=UPI002B202409|nr:hypothetical protein [Proteiniphilum sp.]MEA4918168.1 hypothetical protein [Proteiniphilum sp.]